MNATAEKSELQVICTTHDLIIGSGVCALLNNEEQIAIYYLPKEDKKIYALSNWDPIGKANVMSRGILGDLNGKLVIASPLYKQHFDLLTGQCLEDESASLRVYEVAIEGDKVMINS